MISSLVDQAKLQVETKVTAIIGKIVVAIPILIALGFGTAAAYIYLENQFGALEAAILMAAGFLLLACLIAIAVLIIQRNHRAALRRTAQNNAMKAGIAAAAPVALTAGKGIARTVGFKLPLLLGAAALAAVLLANAADDE